jgi:branched-chain amino acid transport system ATP-binding protein
MTGAQPARDGDTPSLRVRDLTIAFGGIRAVDGVSFDVPAGGILSLIGPNGAGKTTVLNAISGFVRARGSILYGGRELLGRAAYQRARLGIGRTFQNLQLFGEMSLLDNVLVGRHVQMGGNVILDLLGFPVARREEAARERAMETLRRLGLDTFAGRQAHALPFGIQKLAGVARALAAEPDMLLLDEPAAGLNVAETQALGEVITRLRRDHGLTILLVEHNMRLVMGISDRIVVLDEGRALTEGLPEEIARNPAVIEAYLGVVDRPEVMEEVQYGLIDRA